MKEQIRVRLTGDNAADVQLLAEKEQRSIPQMVSVLVSEAMTNRKLKRIFIRKTAKKGGN